MAISPSTATIGASPSPLRGEGAREPEPGAHTRKDLRMPLPDAQTIERAGLLAWPGIEEKWDGQWVRRAAGGYTKRANSTQCLDPDDFEDADLRVISACSWMVIRKIRPVFRITPLSSAELNATL